MPSVGRTSLQSAQKSVALAVARELELGQRLAPRREARLLVAQHRSRAHSLEPQGPASREPRAQIILLVGDRGGRRREVPATLIAVANTVTEMRNVKHAYDEGILAKRGIDY